MAPPLWKIRGQWLKNCNCDYGCPCDFNAKPTRGDCEGMIAMKIEDGFFKDTSLSGLHWAAMYRWPGALHEGNGTMLPIIDEKADENQRNALLTILSGQEQEKTTMYFIMTQIVTTVLEPQFLPIEFEFDIKARTARVKVDGLIETVSEPIKNPVSGDAHRILVNMPEGFEYSEAEIVSASVNKGYGDIKYDWPNSHSSMAHVHHTSEGLVHS
jgi:hypothetical protein